MNPLTLQDDEQAGEAQFVRQVMREYAAALKTNDATALDAMWAPEYSFVTANGAIVSKAQRLDFIRASNTQFESLTSDEESVRLYGDTAVVVACTSARGQGQGRDLSGEYRGTTVLVKKQEKWLMVLQQTNLISAR